MKRVRIEIDEKGNYTMDLLEGFSGMSCSQKAKELQVLLGGDTSSLQTLFTPFTALVFLVFTLLYTPCVAAIATVKREMGGTRAAVLTVLLQCAIAWIVAFLVHSVGMLLGF